MTIRQDHWNICTVYLLKNRCNTKLYIGQAWQSLDARWRIGYKYCQKIYNAINFYGKDKFYYEILTFCATQETANYWEEYFINKYDTINSGYNIRLGGKNTQLSQITKDKIANSIKKLPPRNIEYRNNIAKSKLGKKNGMFGVKHSEERKKQIGLLSLGNKFGCKLTQEQANKIRQLYNEDNNLFLKDLAKMFKVSRITIRNIILNTVYIDHNWKANPPIYKEKRHTNTKLSKIKELLDYNMNVVEIANLTKISKQTIYNIIRKLKENK